MIATIIDMAGTAIDPAEIEHVLGLDLIDKNWAFFVAKAEITSGLGSGLAAALTRLPRRK